MAKANAITEFKASQPFIDAYAVYYGDRFDDRLSKLGPVGKSGLYLIQNT